MANQNDEETLDLFVDKFNEGGKKQKEVIIELEEWLKKLDTNNPIFSRAASVLGMHVLRCLLFVVCMLL